jgi:hypothetical protein
MVEVNGDFAMGQGRRSGQRRSYLKRFSSTVIGGTSTIDKHYFREASQRAHALTHRDIAFIRMFGLDDPTKANELARMQRGERQPFLVETPRDRVLKKLGEYTQEVNPLHNICLIPKTLYMFWDDHHMYFLVKYDRKTETCRRTLKYSSREALQQSLDNHNLKWKDYS